MVMPKWITQIPTGRSGGTHGEKTMEVPSRFLLGRPPPVTLGREDGTFPPVCPASLQTGLTSSDRGQRGREWKGRAGHSLPAAAALAGGAFTKRVPSRGS